MIARRMLLLALPATVATSAPAVPPPEPADRVLRQARAEAQAAEARAEQLEQAAARARGEADRLRAEQIAAAEGIAAAEARISAADAEARLIAAMIASRRQRLRQQQQPIASLLGGLVIAGRRPPLVALAGGDGTDELVRLRLLLGATMPVIRERTAALSAELAAGQRLERSAAAARVQLVRSREQLSERKQRFASLEAQALRSAAVSGMDALSAGDVALASQDDVRRLSRQAAQAGSARQLASELANLGPPPAGPAAGGPPPFKVPFAYVLPAAAAVLEGLGEVSPNGVRSRGLRLATRRGAPVVSPATGIVRFAGPFRDYDGIAIIDHGDGWISLVVNVAPSFEAGARVRGGEPLGRALGELGVELSRNGQHLSPALIAGSSASLSNRRKGG